MNCAARESDETHVHWDNRSTGHLRRVEECRRPRGQGTHYHSPSGGRCSPIRLEPDPHCRRRCCSRSPSNGRDPAYRGALDPSTWATSPALVTTSSSTPSCSPGAWTERFMRPCVLSGGAAGHRFVDGGHAVATGVSTREMSRWNVPGREILAAVVATHGLPPEAVRLERLRHRGPARAVERLRPTCS